MRGHDRFNVPQNDGPSRSSDEQALELAPFVLEGVKSSDEPIAKTETVKHPSGDQKRKTLCFSPVFE